MDMAADLERQRRQQEATMRAIAPMLGQWLDPTNIPARLRSAAATAVDPFGIPSALLGIASPQMRDRWRAQQEESLLGNIAGNVAGTTGALGALPKAGNGVLGMLYGGALGAGSDLIDTANKNGGLTKETALNAGIMGMLYPVNRKLPGVR